MVNGPRGRGLKRLARLVPGVAPRIDAQVDEHDAAVREVFWHSTPIEAPRPAAPVSPAEGQTPSATTPAGTSVSASPAPVNAPPTPDTVREVEPNAAPPAPVTASPPSGQPAREPAPEVVHPVSESAPGFLLRTPASAARIADDFFDGLIRRVEGDR